MTLDEFSRLEGREQFDLVETQGILMGTRENKYFHMTLYRIEDFYVEIKVHKSNNEQFLLHIDHDVLLVPYLDQVDLSKLL